MEPGTDPVSFTLNLPAGLRPTAVNLIDPWTLNVTEAPLKDNGFAVPAVACWLVAVVDLAVAPDAPSLASLYGPPKTFGVPRPGLKEHPPEVVLDPAKTIPELNQAKALLPGNAIIWSIRGISFAALGDLKPGLACIDKALSIDPYCPNAYFCKGMVTEALRQRSGAIAAYEKFLKLAGPDVPEQVEMARSRLAALGNVASR